MSSYDNGFTWHFFFNLSFDIAMSHKDLLWGPSQRRPDNLKSEPAVCGFQRLSPVFAHGLLLFVQDIFCISTYGLCLSSSSSPQGTQSLMHFPPLDQYLTDRASSI